MSETGGARPLQDQISGYYAAQLAAHGAGPRGVGWKDAPSQEKRFAELLRIAEGEGAGEFTLDEYGCGYGALLDWLRGRGRAVDYLGLDITEAMIAEARRLHPEEAGRFHLARRSPRRADYAVASGLFNVRQSAAPADWLELILETLDLMHATSRRGFAFNCLTAHSDPPKMRDDLFYGDPCFFFEHCCRRYSRQVALLHDYGLYDFTILVRKPEGA